MVYKVDGGATSVSRAKTETSVVKKPDVRQNRLRREDTAANAAVRAKSSDADQRATQLRFTLTGNATPSNGGTAATLTLTPTEAESRAEEIIRVNGGKDNLNTDAAGRQLAELSRQNPADAQLVAHEIYSDDRIEDGDRDEIAQSFTRALSDSELEQAANSAEGRTLLKEIQTNLNDGPVHEDEAADSNRIRLALDKNGIFLGSDQGIDYASVEPVSVAQDANATPEQVASYVQMNPSSYDSQTDRYAYLDAVEAHQNDAEWLAQFHSALGSELSGRLISDTLDPAMHHVYGGSGGDSEQAQAQVGAVRTALETMAASGDLTQEGMNSLLGEMRTNPHVAAELFANASDELKTMFINGAISNGDDSWDAGALHVLNTMPAYRQEQILNGLGEKLDPFIEGAMAGQQQMYSFSDEVEHGLNASSAVEELTPTTYGGAERLLETANRTEVYYHAQVAVPAFSPELQLKILDAVGSGLNNDEAFENLAENTAFKDELSRLTINNHNAYLNGDLDADGGATGEDLTPEFRDNYSKIMQMTLFTPPLGEQSTELMQFVDSTYGAIADDLKNLSDTDFEDKYGRNRAAMARAFGETTGVFFKALDEGLTAIKDDAKKAAEVMGPIFKLIDFAVGQGLGKAGPIGKVISTALSLTGASSAAQAAIKEKIENGQIEEALENLQGHGVDLAELGERLYEEVHNNWLPNSTDPNGTYQNEDGTSVSIKDAWQNGYDHIEGAPQTS